MGKEVVAPKNWIALPDLSRVLGLPHQTVYRRYAARRGAWNGHYRKVGKRIYVSPDLADAIVEVITRVPIVDRVPEGYVPLVEAQRGTGIPRQTLLSAIHRGEARGVRHRKRVYIHPADLGSLAERRGKSEIDGDWVSVETASRETGIMPQTIREWSARGYIASSLRRNALGIQVRCVRLDELQRFAQARWDPNWVVISEVFRSRTFSPRCLALAVRAMGGRAEKRHHRSSAKWSVHVDDLPTLRRAVELAKAMRKEK